MSPPLIYLVEDSQADARLVSEAIREAGISAELCHFGNGISAMHRLQEETNPVPALMLLNWHMPEAGGLEVLKMVRCTPRLDKVPIAVLTSSLSPEDKRVATAFGVQHYIQKPVDLNEFVTVVGNAIQSILRG
jgi:chemotaxis family two-component system response regulator Rcp1